ncbi:MAG: VCBS repeat-containing protein, partial [Phycisphaerales bacterium]|nr:VCBS repeat-containing protein [Phycisphaerales bacterium]
FAVAVGSAPIAAVVAGRCGDGLGPITELDLVAWPDRVALGDFDGDGAVDLVVAPGDFDNLEWFRNEAGLLGPSSTASPTAVNLNAMHSADIDEDGRDDIVGYDLGVPGAWTWIQSMVEGPFGASQRVETDDGEFREVAAADVDGDGWLDLTGITWSTGGVAVARASGPGVFGEALIANVDLLLTGHTLLDIDGDGDLEIAAGGTQGLDLMRQGPRTLVLLDPEDSSVHELFRQELDAWGFESGDLDGDGFDDLLVAGWDGDVSLMQSLGDGTFTEAEQVAEASLAADIVVAQLDGRGPLDFALVDNHRGTMSLYLGEYR